MEGKKQNKQANEKNTNPPKQHKQNKTKVNQNKIK